VPSAWTICYHQARDSKGDADRKKTLARKSKQLPAKDEKLEDKPVKKKKGAQKKIKKKRSKKKGKRDAPESDWEGRVKAAFKAVDTDGDGELTFEEMLPKFGHEWSQWYHKEMDSGHGNQDGAVDLGEWEAYFAHLAKTGGQEHAEKALQDIEKCL